MEKNNLVLLGLLGAVGVGAYFLFNNQDQGIGGGGAGGRPGDTTNIFNITPPVFPDLSGFFTDTTAPTTETASKKDAPIIINQADYKPGAVVIVPIKNTIPSTTGGRNFPTVIPIDRSYKTPQIAPAYQPPLKIQNVFGFPVVPHLASSSTTTTKKATGAVVIVPIKNTIPSTTGGQNFPTVTVSTKKTTTPYISTPTQPQKMQNVLGFPVVPHLVGG